MKNKLFISVAIMFIGALLFLGALIGFAIGSANGATSNYTRPYDVVISTRSNGQWVAKCHAVHTDTNRLLYVFGGCLPPVHHGYPKKK